MENSDEAANILAVVIRTGTGGRRGLPHDCGGDTIIPYFDKNLEEQIAAVKAGQPILTKRVMHEGMGPAIDALQSLRKNTLYGELVDPMVNVLKLTQSSAQMEHQRQALLLSQSPDFTTIKRLDQNMETLRQNINQELFRAWQSYDLYYRPYGVPE